MILLGKPGFNRFLFYNADIAADLNTTHHTLCQSPSVTARERLNAVDSLFFALTAFAW